MKNKIALFAALLVVVALAILIFVPNRAESVKSGESNRLLLTPQLPPSSYVPIFTDRTEAGMKKFWAEYLDTTYHEIFAGTFYVTEMQARITWLISEINRRDGNLHMNAVTTYNDVQNMAIAGAAYINGVPTISLMVQRFMDMAESQRQQDEVTYKQKLKLQLVESVHHELEHLYRERGKTSMTTDEFIEAESAAWAQSCRFAIVPLIERYKIAPSADTLQWYSIWVWSGRNETSKKWKDFVRHVYSPNGTVLMPK